jgi:enoyl-CoA hydratase/carnithine racemase
MQNVVLGIKGGIANLRLANGVTNAISPALVAEAAAAVEKVKAEADGLVITGGEKFFTIGWELPSLLQLDRQGMTDFYRNFNNLILDIFTLPMPTVCAVGGHAAGGGNIFALAGDYRFMAEGRKLIGLNEINIGLPIPYLTQLMLWQVVGDRIARDIAYGGDLNSAEHACQIGLVDEVFSAEELEQKAIEKVTTLAQKPGSGFAQMKDVRVEQVRQQYAEKGPEQDEIFINIFFQPEVQALLKMAAEKF